MSEHSFGKAAAQIITIHDALGRNGWYALLSPWHAAVLANAVGSDPDDPQLPGSSWSDYDPEGALAVDAALRWRRYCSAHDLDPNRAQHAVVTMERLGLLVRRRFLLAFRRFAVADPLPPAFEHSQLDAETRTAAQRNATQHRVGFAIGGLLDAGDGHHESSSLEALATAVGCDVATLESVAADGGAGWTLVLEADGRAVVDEIPDPDRDELLDAIDDLPDDP